MKIERKLEETEILCSQCNGIGCNHCCGQGKLDWIQNITGIDKIEVKDSSYYILNDVSNVVISYRTYNASFKRIDNSPNIKQNKVGDIIKFNKPIWDRGKRRVNKKVPSYARGEFGIIIGIYKWIKQEGLYNDYGRIIQMLTGTKIGHIRRYYVTYPWQVITPKNKNYVKFKKMSNKILRGN